MRNGWREKVASLSLRHIFKVYPARHKSKPKKGEEQTRANADFVAVKDFSMEIEDGEFIVFVGPSGCGKSTTLRMIAGLEDISSGELYIGDRLVNAVEPKDRDIAMVFQSYALYPHMTSYDNIAFGLRMRKIPVEIKDKEGNPVIGIDKTKIAALNKKIRLAQGDEKRVQADLQKDLRKIDRDVEKCNSKIDNLKKEAGDNTDLISELEQTIAEFEMQKQRRIKSTELTVNEIENRISVLSKELEYYSTTPVQLYGMRHYTKEEIDEKVKWAAGILGIEELLPSKPAEMSGGQRQRIALGRAMVRGAKVFLLDEPLSNLDAKLRTAMRSEIVKLHKQLKTTFIYVTHDQVEAMTMGTRIVVMKLGVVQQIDTPTNLFDYPDNKFVAGFIGTPQMNFFNVIVKREADNLAVKFDNDETIKFDLKQLRTMRKDLLDGEEHNLVMGARGESISVLEESAEGLSATVNIKELLGDATHLFVTLGGKDYTVCVSDRVNYDSGDRVKLSFNERKLHFFDIETEVSVLGRDFNN